MRVGLSALVLITHFLLVPAFAPLVGTAPQSTNTFKGHQQTKLKAAGFGISTLEDTQEAVNQAVADASQSIPAKPSIAFVSATVKRDIDQVRQAFVEQLPANTLIHGITSSAALLTTGGACAGAVGCLLIAPENEEGSFAAAYDGKDGAAAAKQLKSMMSNPKAIFMSATPGAEEGVIASLAQEFPGVPVYGGTAADDELSGAWAVFSRDASSGTGVSLVGISNQVKFGASMIGPYTPTNKVGKATKTEGRRVLEIDGKPAADWVYAWLGDDVKEQYENGGLILPQTAQKPIGLKQPSGEYLSAHLAALGGAEKFVDFFAPIPEGSDLIVMDSADGPATGYAGALSNAYNVAKGSLGGADPSAAILVFCGGMAIAVGDKMDAGLTSQDFAAKLQGVPTLGMTCFGEQTCLPEAKTNVQRNLSLGLVLFG